MSNTVHVSGIAHSTSEKEVRDFFSFCGKITNLEVKPQSEGADSPKSATVTFEKETAAKTALLLDNTQLGPSQVQVSSGSGSSDSSTAATTAHGAVSGDDDNIAQEDKPRSRIVAEYLAHGYAISDTAIQRAIALDNKHGFSNRFTTALKSFDDKYKATEKAQAVDSKYKVTETANKGWLGLNSYFEKALDTTGGQKLRSFYVEGDKQVRDIHNEARRLADLKGGKATPEKFEGTDKTVCKCGAESGKCGCAPGHCACVNCSKSSSENVEEVQAKAGEHAVDPTPAKV